MSSKKKLSNKSKYSMFFIVILIGILSYAYFIKQTESNIIWKHKANYFLMDVLPNGIAPISSDQLVSSNSAIILVEDQKVFSVDPETGKEKWKYVEPENQYTYEDKITFENNEVKVIDESNIMEFNKKEIEKTLSQLKDLTRVEVKERGRVYRLEGFNPPSIFAIFFMDSTDKFLNIYDANLGKKLWSFKKPVKQAIFRDGFVYFTSDGWVYAVK